VHLYALTPHLNSDFFESLREAYPSFDSWFRDKAREGKRAWVAWKEPVVLGAICIYTQQDDQTITEDGLTLHGRALKLSTFKVSPSARGRKIGELFLKAAFRFATFNRLENVFIHGDLDRHHFLFEMLEDFGFSNVGKHPGSIGRDAVYLKRHPISPPVDNIEPFEYLRRFFPHFRHDSAICKFIIPIRPEYHSILFPDYEAKQRNLFRPSNTAGNAIKLAYLCHAPTKHMKPGELLLFYRSGDEKAITSLGIVERYETLQGADLIAGLVRRRTVYSMREIEAMIKKPTRVMLFRLIKHFERPFSQPWLEANSVLKGPPQSITKISNTSFEKVSANGM
jgi:hypothetical protein